MTFIPIPNVAQLVLGYVTDLGVEFSNGLMFYKDGGWVTSDLQALCEAVEASWGANIDSMCTANINLRGVDARDLTDEFAAYYSLVYPSVLPGVRSGAAQALNVAATVTFRTAQRGRSFRGRVYHVGLANEDRQDEDSFQTTVITALTSAYEDFIEDLEAGATCVHVVASRYTGGAARTFGIHTEVTQVVGRTKIATQRDRLNNG